MSETYVQPQVSYGYRFEGKLCSFCGKTHAVNGWCGMFEHQLRKDFARLQKRHRLPVTGRMSK